MVLASAKSATTNMSHRWSPRVVPFPVRVFEFSGFIEPEVLGCSEFAHSRPDNLHSTKRHSSPLLTLRWHPTAIHVVREGAPRIIDTYQDGRARLTKPQSPHQATEATKRNVQLSRMQAAQETMRASARTGRMRWLQETRAAMFESRRRRRLESDHIPRR